MQSAKSRLRGSVTNVRFELLLQTASCSHHQQMQASCEILRRKLTVKTVAFCPPDATVIGPPWAAAIGTGLAIVLEGHPKIPILYGIIAVNRRNVPTSSTRV